MTLFISAVFTKEPGIGEPVEQEVQRINGTFAIGIMIGTSKMPKISRFQYLVMTGEEFNIKEVIEEARRNERL